MIATSQAASTSAMTLISRRIDLPFGLKKHTEGSFGIGILSPAGMTFMSIRLALAPDLALTD